MLSVLSKATRFGDALRPQRPWGAEEGHLDVYTAPVSPSPAAKHCAGSLKPWDTVWERKMPICLWQMNVDIVAGCQFASVPFCTLDLVLYLPSASLDLCATSRKFLPSSGRSVSEKEQDFLLSRRTEGLLS